MWFHLRPVELDFLETAPKRYVVECLVDLPVAVVWQAIADAPTWPRWWPGLRSAGYQGDPPHGVGTIRVANVGGWHMRETMLAWDVERRYAYRIDRSTAPLAKAQLESTELLVEGTRTRVRWTLAIQPGLMMRLAAPFYRNTVERMLAKAMRNLTALHKS